MNFDFSAFDDPAVREAALASAGPADAVYAGWIATELRTTEEATAHADAVATTPDLLVTGAGVNADATKVALWECWPAARPTGWPGVLQITGSCVGAGGGNMLFSLAAADVVKRRDPERVEVPFWLLPYGISRMLGGLNNRGDGSMGSTFARAVREYGHVPAATEGLPVFADTDGYTWGREAELDWSQGRRIAERWLTMAKPHLVKSAALCRSTDDVREAVRNYYGVTCASNWGGLMRPGVSGTGENAVLVNRRATTWMHQMSVQGWWDHPQFGELFYILNQWGKDVHGRCPSGAPPGGFWVRKGDMQDIVSQGETFAFSGLDGFPALVTPLDFSPF